MTTNFDELFELAVRGAGAEMAVLPTDVGRVTDRWCLKPPLTLTLARALALALTRTLGHRSGAPRTRTLTRSRCLKLHGTVSRPDSIVLTRADYASYSKEQAASQGVLQGLLLTQHVLFVGFSMRDENWCRIAETVRYGGDTGEV